MCNADTLYTQCVHRALHSIFLQKQYLPLLSWSLCSLRPKISTPWYVLPNVAIKNLKGRICQEGIRHELTRVASPHPARKPLILHSKRCNSPFFEEISQCLTLRHVNMARNQNISKCRDKNYHPDPLLKQPNCIMTNPDST